MNSANLVAEIHLKFLIDEVLSTGEPFTCEYVTVLQSFHRGKLRIPWGKVKAEVNLIFPLSSNIQLIACYQFCTILR